MVYSSDRNVPMTKTDTYGSSDIYCKCRTTLVPVPAQVRSMANIVVPVFGGISYDSLTATHRNEQGDFTSGVYPSIATAYRTDIGHQYATRSCGC